MMPPNPPNGLPALPIQTQVSQQHSQQQQHMLKASPYTLHDKIASLINHDDDFSKDYLHNTELFINTAGKYLKEGEISILETAVREVAEMPSRLINISLMKNYKKRWFNRSEPQTVSVATPPRGGAVKSVFYGLVVRQYLINTRRGLPDVSILQQFAHILYDGPLSLNTDRRETVIHLLGFLRAVFALMELGLTGMSNKHVYLNVGAMLEGSGLFYATGGAPSKSTQRRLNMIEHITGVPAKRIRSLSTGSPEGGLGLLENEIAEVQQEESGRSMIPSPPNMTNQSSPEMTSNQKKRTNQKMKETNVSPSPGHGGPSSSQQQTVSNSNTRTSLIYDPSLAPPSKYMKVLHTDKGKSKEDEQQKQKPIPSGSVLNNLSEEGSGHDLVPSTVQDPSPSLCQGQSEGQVQIQSEADHLFAHIVERHSSHDSLSSAEEDDMESEEKRKESDMTVNDIFSLLANYAAFLPVDAVSSSATTALHVDHTQDGSAMNEGSSV
jgi:hypothetical protein